MGRKIDIKKIEDTTKCQVTFSKRRSSLINKAHEISVFCDVDVALLAFSPSGRLSKFCSRNRMEDVLQRYIILPAEKRYQSYINNVEEKLDKLRLFGYIKGEENKMHFLDNQIKSMELQIKRSKIELEMVEANLRDYEPDSAFEPSLAQLLWCERNLRHSLQGVSEKRKMFQATFSASNDQVRFQKKQREMVNRPYVPPVPYNFGGINGVNWATQNPNTNQFHMQLDPWTSPYSSKIREGKLQEIACQSRRISAGKGSYGYGVSNTYTSNLPITSFQPIQQRGISPFIPQAPILPNYTNYAQVQEKPGYDAGYYKYQRYPAQTLNNQWSFQKQNNQIGHIGVIPTQANNVNWSFYGNYNTSHNMSSLPPSSSQSTVAIPGGDPFFTNNITTTSMISGEYIMNNQTSYGDKVEKLAAPEQITPPKQPFIKTSLPDCPSTQAVEGTSETNKDTDSWEWDGFALAETLNLEDLDIVF